MKSRRKKRLPKIAAELLILVEFAIFFWLAVKLAFTAMVGFFYGGLANSDDTPVGEIEQLWSNAYEPLIINIFICFIGFAIIRFVIVMLWDKLRKPSRPAE